MNKPSGCIPLIVFMVAMIAISAIVNGWALSVLWGWFAVPTFHLPPIGILEAVGLTLIVSMLTHRVDAHKDDRDTSERVSGYIGAAIVVPVTAVAIGWIVLQFVQR